MEEATAELEERGMQLERQEEQLAAEDGRLAEALAEVEQGVQRRPSSGENRAFCLFLRP